jgi:hypothetical protein
LLDGFAALSSATWPAVNTATQLLWSAAVSLLLLLLPAAGSAALPERLSMYLQYGQVRAVNTHESLIGNSKLSAQDACMPLCRVRATCRNDL